MSRLAFMAVVAAAYVACKADDGTPCKTAVAPTGRPPTTTSAVIVEIDPMPSRAVYALSDIHGGYDRLALLLAAAHLTEGVPTSPDEMRWSGRDAVLVVVGDLIDKGPQPIEVIDALRALESRAQASGGLVITLLGNHEAEFFADPSNSKASASSGFNVELAAKGIDCGQVASGTDPRGAWLRARPFGARVGRWFFAHAGNTKGRTIADLSQALSRAVVGAGFGDAEITGADSILEARGWYADPAVTVANAHALGVEHFVFGHDPKALGPRGAIGVAQDGRLLRVDCGMSPEVNDSTGCVLRVRREGTEDVAEQLVSDGRVALLFRSPTSP